MRFVALALVSACALAACNQDGPAGGGAFPDLNGASYRAEATVQAPDGSAIPVVMIRSGDKMRMEMTGGQGDVAVVSNGAGGDSFVLMTTEGRTVAMDLSSIDYTNPAEQWGAEYAATATRTGTCSVAGETGSAWSRETDGKTNTTCVTNDGIILQATEDGRTTWETTSVQRGAQSADLFVLPPGVQVMDMSAVAGAAASAAAGGGMTQQVCEQMRSAGAPADALSRAGCS
jgi:outer membrane lipoprotein-sorting protein